jgi:hypothetical protein
VLLKFLKDPLAHFLALGMGLFLLYGALNPGRGTGDDPKLITVDRDRLLTFVQYRTKTFQPKLAAARLDAMSGKQLKRLIDDYVREEALHREAKSLGLGRNDYVIKRRMIQKIDFITQGFAEAVIKVSDDDLMAYYDANKERYLEPAFLTFTHVFFDAERHGSGEAKALAETKLALLRSDAVAFSDAPKHGERFPYGVNYVERTRDHVESHFGKSMTKALFDIEPDDGAWRGPYLSPYGAHLVMVVNRKDARIPSLEEVRRRVEADLTAKRKKEQSEKAIKAIVDTYRIDIDLKDKDGKDVAGLRPDK